MLGLHYKTPDTWAAAVLADPAQLLLDHYFCELKAAAMARRTLKIHGRKYPVLKKLMVELADEELDHAQQVERVLKERHDWPRATKGGNRYAQGLRRIANERGHGRFLEMLLACSLIEARSAERFQLLADELKGQALGGFYADLYASEVNHYALFVDLAVNFFGEEAALARLDEMRAAEAALILSLPEGPRMH